MAKIMEKLAVATALLALTTSCDYRTLDSKSFFDDEEEKDGKKQEQVADTTVNNNIVYNNIFVENLEYVDGIKIVDNSGKIVMILDNNGNVVYQENNCCECGDTVVQPMDTIVQDTVKPQPKPQPRKKPVVKPQEPECGCTTKVTTTVKHSVTTEYGYKQYCNGGASR